MRLSLSHSRTSSSSARSSSPAGSPTAFLPPSPLLLGGGGSPAHAHQHRRRRSSHPLLLSRSTLARHRWLLLALLALSLWLALSARTVPFVVLGSTYVLSSSFPPPVLGQADGFDLALLVPSPNRSTPVVPRVIHQVQLGGLAMRPAWAAAREACATLHPADDGWVFRLWDDAAGDAFVRERYPHLFALYRSYDQEIMRSNVLRYLVLHAFGGIYRASSLALRFPLRQAPSTPSAARACAHSPTPPPLFLALTPSRSTPRAHTVDLDLRCRVKLDAFLGEDFVTPPAQPIGVNNAFVRRLRHPSFLPLYSRLMTTTNAPPPSRSSPSRATRSLPT